MSSPALRPDHERAQRHEEGADHEHRLDQVPGHGRAGLLLLLPERGVVGAVGVEAGLGRAHREARHQRPGQLRGSAHEVLPAPEEGRVPGWPSAEKRLHRHVETHVHDRLQAQRPERDVLPAPCCCRERERTRLREDVHVRDQAHRHAPPLRVPRACGRGHVGRDHQHDPVSTQGRPEDRLHVEVREGIRRHNHEPVRGHPLRPGREGGQGHACGPDQHLVPGLGHVVERGPRREQVRVAQGGRGDELVLEEDPGLRRVRVRGRVLIQQHQEVDV